MMPNYNHVTLMGNITRDIEVKYTPGGTAVCEIGLAVNESWFDKQANEKKERTTFVDCTAWGKTAELAGEYLSKGKPLFLSGKLQTDSWEDKQSGQRRTKLKVVVDHMQFIGGKGGGGQSRDEQRQSESGEESQEPKNPFPEGGGGPPATDEVPFSPSKL